ncbi:deoxyribose-phosphate aldolase [Maritimibacter sp. 55A14]|uniref:deoxyribose-phosphate aldolase n=1 Tax=Maritimibacter sp. 55A14 TaxID=2174844 RepID=UPI000D604329|nr:deoxyribose-phosphate aldolase [Maritimibacter sp. 55A14]PWE31319.1 deoxyribose-phosphate aldolase [Maritimibacter sp. 55A14]
MPDERARAPLRPVGGDTDPPPPVRNPGLAFDADRIAAIRVNARATASQAHTIATRRPVAPAQEPAWLMRAIALTDLTTLSGDDTPGRVRRLAAKARAPLGPALTGALGPAAEGLHTAALCVYHEMIPAARAALAGSGIPVAAVSAGFPAGLSPFDLRVDEVRRSVAAGADEIDIVISRRHVLLGDWAALHAEIRAFREACGPAHLKAILATGELGSLTDVARASMVAMMAGADFIKTSTGKEPVNATLSVSLTMLRAIRAYEAETGARVGFKPAGGISKAADALSWMALVQAEAGDDWLTPGLFRFGASSLLGAIEKRLGVLVWGHAPAPWQMPMG